MRVMRVMREVREVREVREGAALSLRVPRITQGALGLPLFASEVTQALAAPSQLRPASSRQRGPSSPGTRIGRAAALAFEQRS